MAAIAAATVGAAETSTRRQNDADYAKLSFDILASYEFTPPTIDAALPERAALSTADDQVPAAVKRWHGRKVIVTGFMQPVKSEKGLVTELLLTRNTMARGNLTPFMMNEWIIVKIRPGVRAQTLEPVSFLGTLKIGAIFENKYMIGIYELAADRMSERPVH